MSKKKQNRKKRSLLTLNKKKNNKPIHSWEVKIADPDVPEEDWETLVKFNVPRDFRHKIKTKEDMMNILNVWEPSILPNKAKTGMIAAFRLDTNQIVVFINGIDILLDPESEDEDDKEFALEELKGIISEVEEDMMYPGISQEEKDSEFDKKFRGM